MALVLVATMNSAPQAATPTFSPAAGTYTSAQSVTISTMTPSASIYYTTDGTTPTYPVSGTTQLYSGAVSVSATGTLKAIATAAGYTQSAVGSAAYTINIGVNFPLTMSAFLDTDSPYTPSLSSWQQAAAKYDYLMFQAYGGLEQVQGITFASLMSTIKSYALSSLGGHVVMTGFYQIDQEYHQTTSTQGATNTVQINAGNNNQGWALQASGYPSGSKVAQETYFWVANVCSSASCPAYTINTVGTLAGPSSPSGANLGAVNWSQFVAWWEVEYLINGNWAAMEDGSEYAGNYFAVNPHVDFINHDNWFMGPRSAGCWLSTSTVYNTVYNPESSTGWNQVAVPMQQGQAEWATVIRTLVPGMLVSANIDYLDYYDNSDAPQILDSSNQNFWDFSLAEAPVGGAHSIGNSCGSFQNLVNAMLTQEQTIKSTGYVFFDMDGANASVQWEATQQTIFTTTYNGMTPAQSWQAARYQIGLACMMRWISSLGSWEGDVWWFDEWDAGTGTLNWLGAPVGTRNFTPNAQGIIVLQFTNGVAYLYPAGNNDSVTGLSPVTLTSSELVGGGGTHINSNSYYSDPAINTGAAFTTLTINPRDCIFTLL